MNTLLMMMGGSGTRFGADIPKQYLQVNDVPIFAYILKEYNKIAAIENIIIVSHYDWIDYVRQWSKIFNCHKVIDVVSGGSTRSESVKNGLICASKFSKDDDIILIHDATHPYVDEQGTLETIDAVQKYGAATLAAYNYDTVYKIGSNNMIQEVVERKNIVAGASPEAFRFRNIHDIYMNSSQEQLDKMTSAGAMALSHGIDMFVVEANIVNLKITYPKDMKIFKELATNYFFKEETAFEK